MSVLIRHCEPDELPIVISRLDQEFVSGKQRSLSLARRFPNTLSKENLERICVAVSEDGVCGANAVRMFDWVAEDDAWRGAMVGMVWVDPLLRSQGIGRQLMTYATQSLRESGVDFGVLWTGTHAFYERGGWFLGDRGLLGEVANCGIPPCDHTVSCRDLARVEPNWLERVRSHFLRHRVARTPLDYRTVPTPALHVSCFSAHGNDGGEGFALVGEQGGTGYFYEMVAPPVLWGAMWRAISGRFDRLVVNGRLGDPFSQWLADEGHVVWHPQSKTMWLHVSHRSEDVSTGTWHIPYFDWI